MKTLTETIFNSTSPYNNPYQGQDKKVLFVCSAGLLRSATAARIYARKYNTRAAGTAPYALIPLSDDLIIWANEIVFVNEENYRAACTKWDLDNFKREIKVLNIPDQYEHMHPELIKHFEQQYETIAA